jgi:DNA-binding NtrC family response regulator
LFFICSTSKSLVKSDFHPEFFKLITPLRIPMPPLRERKEDIVSIACAILKSVHSESRKEVPLLKLEKPARHWLENQRWGSGNIEELAWVVKCASNRCTGDSLAVDDLICCQQEIIELEQPSSELIGTIAAPLPQKPETPAMVKGPFQFDIAANKLLIRGGRMLDVPQRFSEVLSSMMTKSGLGHSGRLSALTYAAVASLFEKGKLQEEKRDLTEAQRQKLLKGRKDRIERQQKEIAQEFSRQFSKWLRRNKVDPHSVFKCNRKSKQYQLSFGWKQGRMVLGDSQVRGGGDRGRNIEDLAVQDGLDEPAEDHESPGTADDDPDGCEND